MTKMNTDGERRVRAGLLPPFVRIILPITLLSAACVGVIGDGSTATLGAGGGGSGASGGSGGANGADGGASAATASAGLHGLQRLTADELKNTMHDLLGIAAATTATLPADGVNESGFNAPGVTSEADARTILQATESVIAALDDATWSSLLGCATATRSDACVSAFVARFGPLAYRRPITADETSDLLALYTGQMSAKASFNDATRLVLEAILNAPGFLYHTEGLATPAQVDATGLVKLGGYELASRLSYLLTRSMPDATLLAAAASGGLDTVDGITAQVTRLLETPAARQMVGEFGAEWLGSDGVLTTGKNTSAFPDFTPALQASMAGETRAFFQHVILDDDHTFPTLMTAPYAMVDGNLASFYGLGGVTGSTFQKVPTDPTQRFGFLTEASLLTVNSDPSLESPIFRGKLIQTRLLCLEMGPPPKAFPPPAPSPGTPMTVRQMLERVHTQPGCNSCHQVLDPPGFAFGGYDAIGQVQTTENGLPLDTTGSITLPSGGTLAFQGARDLAQGLSTSADAKDCFTRQWYRFALQRKETAGEAPAVAGTHAAFEGAGLDVQQLILSVATSVPFRYRSPAAGEVFQ